MAQWDEQQERVRQTLRHGTALRLLQTSVKCKPGKPRDHGSLWRGTSSVQEAGKAAWRKLRQRHWVGVSCWRRWAGWESLEEVPRRGKTWKNPEAQQNRMPSRNWKKSSMATSWRTFARATQDLAVLILKYLVSHEKVYGFILVATGNGFVYVYTSIPTEVSVLLLQV